MFLRQTYSNLFVYSYDICCRPGQTKPVTSDKPVTQLAKKKKKKKEKQKSFFMSNAHVLFTMTKYAKYVLGKKKS